MAAIARFLAPLDAHQAQLRAAPRVNTRSNLGVAPMPRPHRLFPPVAQPFSEHMPAPASPPPRGRMAVPARQVVTDNPRGRTIAFNLRN